jgi:hypothetical protein
VAAKPKKVIFLSMRYYNIKNKKVLTPFKEALDIEVMEGCENLVCQSYPQIFVAIMIRAV